MKRFLGATRSFAYVCGLVAGAAVLGSAACGSSDGNGSAGSAGAVSTAGAGATAGTLNLGGGGGANAAAGSHAGGSSAVGGSAGSTSSAGGSGGTGGASSTGSEIAVSLTACMPACPGQQYCALIGETCTTEPCIVHTECRDLPVCGASMACPVPAQNSCYDDPSDTCNPSSGSSCPGRCFCTEGPHPCGTQALDRRPTVCACVTPGTTKDCLDVNCPGSDTCEIILGKAYCIEP